MSHTTEPLHSSKSTTGAFTTPVPAAILAQPMPPYSPTYANPNPINNSMVAITMLIVSLLIQILRIIAYIFITL